MTNDERRTLTGPVELREHDGKRIAVGYAAKFETRSDNLGGFVETVARTAFTKTLSEGDIVALRDHDTSRLLGRVSAGTLRLSVDQIGLHYEIDLPDTSEGRDTGELLSRGDLRGSSFGFRAIEDDWTETESGYPLRVLIEVQLRDVGPVTFPAYSDTRASLRHLAETRHLNIDELVEAAKAGELNTLILPDHDGDGKAEKPSPFVPHRRRY